MCLIHKEDLWNSILGMEREIKKREGVLRDVRYYLRHPTTSNSQYSMRFIYMTLPKVRHEIWKLKVIRVELFYQYNLKLLFEKVNLK